MLQGFHAIVAFQMAQGHWLLNDADAKRYSQALGNALRHMQIRAAQKTIDFSALVFVSFSIEAPRIMRSLQLARDSHLPPPRPSATVFQFTTPQGAASAATEAPPPMAEGPPDFGEGAA